MGERDGEILDGEVVGFRRGDLKEEIAEDLVLILSHYLPRVRGRRRGGATGLPLGLAG